MTSGKFTIPRLSNYFGARTLKKRIQCLFIALPKVIRNEYKICLVKKLLQ